MALTPRTVQNMPDCLRREPILVLQPLQYAPADKQVSATEVGVAHPLPPRDDLGGRTAETSSIERLAARYLDGRCYRAFRNAISAALSAGFSARPNGWPGTARCVTL
jgi:hypothetical protein